MSEEYEAGPHPMYGVPIHEAIASGDLEKMKAISGPAESHVNDVAAALKALKEEIAKLEAGG